MTPEKKMNKFRILIKERFFLRFHMSLILAGTFLFGLLVTKLLLIFHANKMLIRYPIAVLFSYLAFFAFIKLWLLHVSSSEGSRRFMEDAADGVSSIPDFSVDIASAAPDPFSGGGGHFGGGGASSSLDSVAHAFHEASSEAVVSASADSAGDGITSAVGDAAGGIFEDAGVILVILGVLLALIFGAGIYLIYEAPMILSEAAFEFLLATTLIRGMKKMDNPDWIGSVLRTTLPAFLFTLFVAIVLALIAQSAYPRATKLSEVVKFLLSKQ